MAKFKVGDRVRCIRGSGNFLREGDEFVVLAETSGFGGPQMLRFTQQDIDFDDGWYASRFELVEGAARMPKFKVGDRVRCIDGARGGPLRGQVYTVKYPSRPLPAAGEYLFLEELAFPFDGGWDVSRFELWEDAPHPALTDKYDPAWKAFTLAMRERHEGGKSTYGNKSWESPPSASIQDMKEEVIDLGNYAAHLYYKLDQLEHDMLAFNFEEWRQRALKAEQELADLKGGIANSIEEAVTKVLEDIGREGL